MIPVGQESAVSGEHDCGPTKRGRPRKAGRSVRVTLRLREGDPEVDAILQRLAGLPRGRRSACIRRVLAGAPVEVLEGALAKETADLAASLDGMWAGDWEDD
ncbi:MAG TPA: hypothetical protein PKO09_12750 [Anaerolineae bacterium]|nr:hypothetical protein [Anaerolineae bacterium]